MHYRRRILTYLKAIKILGSLSVGCSIINILYYLIIRMYRYTILLLGKVICYIKQIMKIPPLYFNILS